MGIEEDFKAALDLIKNGKPSGDSDGNTSNQQKLAFYAYFKQATEGQNKGKRPGMFDVVARAKYDAWAKLGQMSKEDAMKGYIKTLEEITPNWKQLYSQQKQTDDQQKKEQLTTSGTSATKPSERTFNLDMLKGKVALVTGGGTGIGKVITECFMKHGADTIITSRKIENLQKASKELEAKYPGRRCLAVSADVREYDKLSSAIDNALSKMGSIDILVNGAAGNFLCLAEKLSTNAFKTVLDIDTVGTFNTSKLVFLKWMKQHGGVIINLSMNLHHYGQPLQVHAGAAKAAIDSMTRQLAVEWGLNNVRVNSIAIGPIEGTEGMKRLSNPKFLNELRRKVPLQRFGTCEDIANACLFLSSDGASYVTGSVLTVDGASYCTFGGFMYPEQITFMSKM